MGKVFQTMFGGKRSKEVTNTHNQAYDQLNTTFSPITAQAGTGADALSKLLGGDSSGFDAYKKATGYDAMAEAGSRGITGNAAAGGLLRSGSTGKALQSYGTGLQNQYAQSYLGNLFNQANLGIDAGKLIGGVGQVSNGKSTSSEKPGISGVFGKPMAKIGLGGA